MKRIEMNFFAGRLCALRCLSRARYNRETLFSKYKGKSIAELLDTTVEEALPILE